MRGMVTFFLEGVMSELTAIAPSVITVYDICVLNDIGELPDPVYVLFTVSVTLPLSLTVVTHSPGDTLRSRSPMASHVPFCLPSLSVGRRYAFSLRDELIMSFPRMEYDSSSPVVFENTALKLELLTV